MATKIVTSDACWTQRAAPYLAIVGYVVLAFIVIGIARNWSEVEFNTIGHWFH